jgi:hypothetical protein
MHIKKVAFCYTLDPEQDPHRIAGMYYYYHTLAKLFPENIAGMFGDVARCRHYHINLMYYCNPDNLRRLNG